MLQEKCIQNIKSDIKVLRTRNHKLHILIHVTTQTSQNPKEYHDIFINNNYTLTWLKDTDTFPYILTFLTAPCLITSLYNKDFIKSFIKERKEREFHFPFGWYVLPKYILC